MKTFELVANSERRYETASLDDAGIASPAIGSTFPYLHNVIMFFFADGSDDRGESLIREIVRSKSLSVCFFSIIAVLDQSFS